MATKKAPQYIYSIVDQCKIVSLASSLLRVMQLVSGEGRVVSPTSCGRETASPLETRALALALSYRDYAYVYAPDEDEYCYKIQRHEGSVK